MGKRGTPRTWFSWPLDILFGVVVSREHSNEKIDEKLHGLDNVKHDLSDV